MDFGGNVTVMVRPDEFPYASAVEWAAGYEGIVIQMMTVYLVSSFGIQWFMRDRAAFDLRWALIAWNGIMAGFSGIGLWAMSPVLWRVIRDEGLSNTYTHITALETDTLSGLFYFVWIISKFFEYIDTWFIVLRKKPLPFMHWWHHLWSSYAAFVSFASGSVFMIWGAWNNYFVHVFLYGFYFFRSIGIRLPSAISQFVTVVEMLQMITWNLVLFHVLYIHYTTDLQIPFTGKAWFWAFFTTDTLLLMFIQYYSRTFFRSKGKEVDTQRKMSEARC